MSQRHTLIKKIKAILGKTVENGCTEEEALTAASHAAQLMQQYDLTFKDIEEIRGQKFDKDRRTFGCRGPSGRRTFPAVQGSVRAIADFYDCVCWFHDIDLVFFGSEDDTDLAHATVTQVQATIQHETNAYLNRTVSHHHHRTERASFEHGITTRINSKYKALKRARTEADKQAHEVLMAADASASTFRPPVVVAKKLIVRENFEALGIKLRSRGGGQITRSHDAYQAGLAAGERVRLTPARGLLKSGK